MEPIFDLVDADDGAAVSELVARDPTAAAARDESGLSPLVRALYKGSRAAFDALRETVPPTDPWDRLVTGESDGLPAAGDRSPDGFTPLHLAAFAHNAAGARALLAAGADPDAISQASFARVTPLGTCAFVNAVEVARVLLDHGADPSIAEDGGGTPLSAAEANGFDELARLLRARS